MSVIIDRLGMTYTNAVALQQEHLFMWASRLQTCIFEPVLDYCLATNREATDATQTHRVYRGQDLVQIILDWPDLKPCYAPAPKPEGTIEVVLKRDVEAGQLLRVNDYNAQDAI